MLKLLEITLPFLPTSNPQITGVVSRDYDRVNVSFLSSVEVKLFMLYCVTEPIRT